MGIHIRQRTKVYRRGGRRLFRHISSSKRLALPRENWCRSGRALRVLPDGGLEALWISAANRVDFDSVLQEQKGGHSGDTILLGDILSLIHIDFGEDDVLVLLAECFVTRCDGVARQREDRNRGPGTYNESPRGGLAQRG